MKKLLIIGLVWPEPTSSAAGTRMLQLIQLFLAQQYNVYFACAASKSDFSFPLSSLEITELEIELNNESFNNVIKDINPDVVLFDRYLTEEQYGWRVSEVCPKALKILDTEDLHFLRYARQEAVKKGLEFSEEMLYSDYAKREIASILRCDISILISKVEMDLLQNKFSINPDILYYLPFLEQPITNEEKSKWKNYEQRDHFIFIGNFIHEPNYNCVYILKTQIWPLLRNYFPKAELHIYGAYANHKVNQLHNPKERFIIKGRAKDALDTMSNYKVLLAPISFGAGLKGKFIDAMKTGTPNVTTEVGAEAMQENLEWNGMIAKDYNDFVMKAKLLYEDKDVWTTAQTNGLEILNKLYDKDLYETKFIHTLNAIESNLEKHRQNNFIGQILQHHAHQSTKFMSLWIEQKNKPLSK